MDDAGERVVADRALVAAIAAGDPKGLEGAYRRYADRLHAYSRSLVGDREAAADVVHDTFLIAAERVGQLRDPDRLGAWLYAIARSVCLRRLRLRRHTVTWADPPELAADGTDPGRAVQAAQVQALVRAATAGLNSGDREVIELAVRHDLSPVAISSVLGVSTNHAHARVSRARTQLESALGALLVARAGAGRCEALDALLLGWDGTLTPLLRKRINRHVRDCQPCATRRSDWLSPSALLSAYAALPFVAVGLAPKSPQWMQGGSPGQPPAAIGRAPVNGPPPVAGMPDGGPQPTEGPASPEPQAIGRAPVGPRLTAPGPEGGPPPRRTRRTLTVAAAILIVLLLGGGIAVATALRSGGLLGAGAPGDPPTVAASDAGGAGLGGQPTAGGTPGSTDPGGGDPSPGGSDPGSPVPTVTASKGFVFVAPFTAHASARPTCSGGSFQLAVGVEASAALASATLYWQTLIIRTRAMELDGSDARRTVTVFRPQVTWWVVVKATDGRTVTTPHEVAQNPCP